MSPYPRQQLRPPHIKHFCDHKQCSVPLPPPLPYQLQHLRVPARSGACTPFDPIHGQKWCAPAPTSAPPYVTDHLRAAAAATALAPPKASQCGNAAAHLTFSGPAAASTPPAARFSTLSAAMHCVGELPSNTADFAAASAAAAPAPAVANPTASAASAALKAPLASFAIA